MLIASLCGHSFPEHQQQLPYREVKREVLAGFLGGDRCVPAEFVAPSREQTSAPRPVAVQLQGVAKVDQQSTWTPRKMRVE